MRKTAAERQATYRARHPERVKAARIAATGQTRKQNAEYRSRPEVMDRYKKWRIENRERNLNNKKDYYEKNKQVFIDKAKVWIKAHPQYQQKTNAAKCAKRRAARINSCPLWANSFFIREIYDLAKRRTKCTGIPWHVDHIVPLRSKFVCGLHVEQNLQVIPAIQNFKKGNRSWPDMP